MIRLRTRVNVNINDKQLHGNEWQKLITVTTWLSSDSYTSIPLAYFRHGMVWFSFRDFLRLGNISKTDNCTK